MAFCLIQPVMAQIAEMFDDALRGREKAGESGIMWPDKPPDNAQDQHHTQKVTHPFMWWITFLQYPEIQQEGNGYRLVKQPDEAIAYCNLTRTGHD